MILKTAIIALSLGDAEVAFGSNDPIATTLLKRRE
jgi:hypothetical protein